MRNIKYFFQFIVIIFLFFLFKILGYKLSSNLSGYIFSILGPLFRSNYIANKNLEKGIMEKYYLTIFILNILEILQIFQKKS